MNINELKKFGIDGGSKKGKLIIDISSEWCAPCKILSHTLEKFRDKDLIKLIQLDLYEHSEFVKAIGVSNVPTLLFFKNGQLLEKDIKINGQILVKSGVMRGTVGELILQEIIKQM
jgi:thioredoxin 1